MTMPNPTNPPAPAPTGTPPTGNPPASTDPPAADRTFTQAELDRIVGDRLARERSTKYGDYDDLKVKATKLDELELANKTELEKEKLRADTADKNAAAAVARANEALLRSAVIAAASRSNVVDPDAVVAMIDKSKLTVNDDGTVSGIDDALKAMLVDKPYLVGKANSTTPGGSADGGARGNAVPGQLTREDLKGMSPEAIVKAKAEGRLNNALGIA